MDMKKKITLGKILMILLIASLSIAVLSYNESLRVPSIFDGRLYLSARLPKAAAAFPLPEKPSVLPDLADWSGQRIASAYSYPDVLLQQSSTTAFLVVKNDTVIFKRYMNGVKEGDNTQLFSITKVFVTTMLGMAIRDKYIADAEVPVTKYFNDQQSPHPQCICREWPCRA
jgi:CubicO group peptidase (beta-lactamase class C family)